MQPATVAAVSIVLLLLVVIVSVAIVRLAAVALELTGVPWQRAKFQALSAFTNTGFPTSEAEEVVRHPLRRKIISYLIVLGNAGLITTVATLASSLIETHLLVALRNLAIIVAGIVAIVWIAHRPALARRLRASSEKWLARRYQLYSPPPAELLHLHEGYALKRLTVEPSSPAVGRTLQELRRGETPIQVLVVERGLSFIPLPPIHTALRAGDRLVVYGAEGDFPTALGLDVEELVVATREAHSASERAA